MNKTQKITLAIIMAVILPANLLGSQASYSRALFVGEIKDSEKIAPISESISIPVSSEISEIEEVENFNSGSSSGSNNSNLVQVPTTCTGDLNQDGVVDSSDVALVTASWNVQNSGPEFSSADLNQDGIVDGADLGLVLGNWGACEGSNPTTCFGDINLDGVVNSSDVTLLKTYWNVQSEGSEFSSADLNQDGIVDGADLGLVLGNWGACPNGTTDSAFAMTAGNSSTNPDTSTSNGGEQLPNIAVESAKVPTNESVVVSSGSNNMSPEENSNTTDDDSDINTGVNTDDTSDTHNSNTADGLDQTQDTNNNDNSSGGGSHHSGSSRNGEVLGASTVNIEIPVTACPELYLKDYIKYGANNNPEQVKKLQIFLNNSIKANLPVTGFYGEKSFNAVKDFQSRFNKLVLKPWADAGLLPNDTTSTGYVYETTRFWINAMMCGGTKNLATPIIK